MSCRNFARARENSRAVARGKTSPTQTRAFFRCAIGTSVAIPCNRRKATMTRITRILVPTDFSATADAALEYAWVLAEQFGASLELLHVLDDPFVADGMAAEAYISEAPALRSAMLHDAQERLRHRAVPQERRATPV